MWKGGGGRREEREEVEDLKEGKRRWTIGIGKGGDE